MFYLPFYLWSTMVECGRVAYYTKDMKDPVVMEDTIEDEENKKGEDTKEEKDTIKSRVKRYDIR